MSALTVLALDVSSKPGWAVSTGASGAADLTRGLKNLTPTAKHAQIAYRLDAFLADLITDHEPAVLVIEQLAGRMLGEAARVLPGLRFVALRAGYLHEIAVEEIGATTWQAWATARGLWSREGKSDEADAKGLLGYYMAERVGRLAA